MQQNKIRVGLTTGDPNGIGYEVILKVLADSRISELCTPILYGNKSCVDFYSKNTPSESRVNFQAISAAEQASPKKPNLIELSQSFTPVPGEVTELAGSMAIASLKAAVRDIKQGKLDVLVTCPINKKNTTGDGFGFVGHTEFLAAEFGDVNPLMFMISDTLKVGLVTMHIPLEKVTENITTQNVLDHIRLMKLSLERDFSIVAPKIAVLGLNPHAGDDGLLGTQEKEVIIPALQSAEYEGVVVRGPFAADGYFGSGAYTKFDVTLAMYHDQGLAPFKAITFADGVNFTAGLSIVRTSPAHGVGYDIAGRGVADEAPLRASIYAAIDIFRSRSIFAQINANPLQHAT
ncbi:MAG: 4-hydroxythreonine-4-phosphate dehydrogenase PdxA, partial [Mucinivorans sp.]